MVFNTHHPPYTSPSHTLNTTRIRNIQSCHTISSPRPKAQAAAIDLSAYPQNYPPNTSIRHDLKLLRHGLKAIDMISFIFEIKEVHTSSF
jgi:hypothetical protein